MSIARMMRSSSSLTAVLLAASAVFACEGGAPDDLDLLVLGGSVIDGSGGGTGPDQ